MTIEQLQIENTTLKRQLAEALYALHKLTGCNWERAIESRALPTVQRKTCETCKGLGEIPVDKWSQACGIEPSRCESCRGDGEIYVNVPAVEVTP